jgi:K+-transporting ATPase ATPase A chain
MWTLPILILALTFVLAVPLGLYMARIFDGRARLPGWLRWAEARLDTGPQNWKQYCLAFLLFNLGTFVIGFLILTLQPWLPLNPDNKGMLEPSTILHTTISFLTNTNQQHYSGAVHLSYFSQLFFIGWKQILSPVLGLCALLAIIRGPRGDKHMGNFYVDLWRGVVYWFVPICLVVGVLLLAAGVPMTLDGNAQVATLEPGAMGTDDAGANKLQAIAPGPVAAVVAVKQFGTNGGGFFGPNSAHPFENPYAFSNLLTCMGLFLLPVATLVMFGKMLSNFRHAAVIFGVMLVLSVTTIVWAITFDTLRPNPGLAGLPVDQELGNLEGKELRFGISAGATWAALTTNTSNGSVNCMHDSLNPLAGAVPLAGMWLNCI